MQPALTLGDGMRWAARPAASGVQAGAERARTHAQTADASKHQGVWVWSGLGKYTGQPGGWSSSLDRCAARSYFWRGGADASTITVPGHLPCAAPRAMCTAQCAHGIACGRPACSAGASMPHLPITAQLHSPSSLPCKCKGKGGTCRLPVVPGARCHIASPSSPHGASKRKRS